jgi:hypothetical protein
MIFNKIASKCNGIIDKCVRHYSLLYGFVRVRATGMGSNAPAPLTLRVTFHLYILCTVLSVLLLFKLTHNLQTVHEIDVLKIRPKRLAHAQRV